MRTDVTVTDHAFGEHDMFTRTDNLFSETNPGENVQPLYEVDIDLYGGPTTETEVSSCYILHGFLKVAFPDGQTIHYNVNEIKSFVVTPL